jgi:hypothetical protein
MTYSLDIINLVIDKYNSNTSIIEIAQIMDIDKNTIYNWFRKYRHNFKFKIFITDKDIIKNTHKSLKIHNYTSTIVDFVDNRINGNNHNDVK